VVEVKRDTKFAIALIIPLIAFVATLDAYPIAYSFWLSLQNYDLNNGRFIFIGLANYSAMVKDPDLLNALFVTLRFTIESTMIGLGLGLSMALLLNESFRGRTIVRVIILLPWAFSTYVVSTLYRYLLSPIFGFYDSILLDLHLVSQPITFLSVQNSIDWVCIAFAWYFSPLIAFFFLAGLQVIPDELYKQCTIDGGGPFRRFTTVTLPYLRHSLIVSGLFAILAAASETALIIGLTGGGPGTATQTLTYWAFAQTFTNLNFGYGAAISWILLLVTFIIGFSYLGVLGFFRRAKLT
jgi:multiple sugar transport system permease protein